MSQRHDDTPTRPTPFAVADVDAFRKDPRDERRFETLRRSLRDGGQGEALAEVCELRAPFEPNPTKAAEIWAEAGEARAVHGQVALAERDLRAAVALEPASDRACARLVEMFLATGKYAEAGDVLEGELGELSRRADSASKPTPRPTQADKAAMARRATRHRLAAQVWDEHLGRVDRALYHWQQAWRLEPERTDALAAARTLYASLGDDAMVAKLYRAELDVLGDKAPAPGRAQLWLALGKIELRRGDAAAAAAALEKALRLDGELAQAREALAEVYASPTWTQAAEDPAAGTRKAGAIYMDLGKAALGRAETEQGLAFLRRAVGVDPFDPVATTQLEEALRAAGKWEELERVLAQRIALTEDEAERVALLQRKIALHERERPDRAALIAALTELTLHEPPRGAAATRLRQLLREDQRWSELAALVERDLAGLADDPRAQVIEILDLAALTREHLGDKDKAAELLHQALSLDPSNEDALARYVEHFRERRDFRGLADLYEFSLENARDAGAPPAELVRRLEEIAQICELRLGDVPRALDAWRRIEEIEPGSPKAREAVRRLSARAKMWEQLVAVLDGEAQAAASSSERAGTLRRIAQTYRERQVEPRRAISLYEEVLDLSPDDDGALKALTELYEREGDDAGLARTLRRQLELDARRLADDMAAAGKPPTAAREWPVGKRVERLTMLRRLAAMCETRLADADGVVFACGGILEILPGDRDALDRMERVLEQAGDKERLEQTLEYHAASATGPAERARVLRRLARMATEAGDDARALDRWEQALKAAPTDEEILAAVADLYERAQRWGELASVLERLDAVRYPSTTPPPAPGSTAAALRARDLARYAAVVDGKLGDGQRAIKAWERLREATPRDRAALDALARLYRGAARYRELAELLWVHVEVFAVDDVARATAAARERATVLAERLGATEDAIRQLERLVSELDPTDLDAHTMLRRLHEVRGDYQAAVKVAERELYLVGEPQAKVVRALEIGVVCRDRLGDPARALQAYERVLAIDPQHDEALAAAADLHERLGDYKNAARVLERRLARAEDVRQRKGLLARLATLTAEKLGDHKAGFKHWRRAHDEAPDATTLAELKRAAEAYGLWRELAEVWSDERRRLLAAGGGGVPSDVDAYVAASRELATVCERRLSDRPRAMTALLEALVVAPRDGALLAEAERLAAEGDQRPLWKQLTDGYDVALRAATTAGRVELHQKKARVLDERLGEPKQAATELLAAFAWAPDRDDLRTGLYRLAEKNRTWSDVIAVEAALAERADGADRLAALRRRAQVIEEQLKDLPRAFRGHLVGFLLAPEDPDTLAHLWRLARAIGRYREVDRTPKPEAAPAIIHDGRGEPRDDGAAPAGPMFAMRSAPVPVAVAASPSGRVRRDSTQELGDSDLRRGVTISPVIESEDDDDAFRVGDSTQPIDLDELLPASASSGLYPVSKRPVTVVPTRAERNDKTMELDISDLAPASAVMKPAPRTGGGLPGLPGLPGVSGSRTKLPPPPPKAPRIEPRGAPVTATGPSVPPPAAPRKAQASVRRPPLPQLLIRAYESPWEELAAAYDSLPAPDAAAKTRWLYRAADAWENGAHDIPRAFDTLSRALGRRDGKAPDGGDGEARARLHRLAADHDEWDRLADLYETLGEDAHTAEAAADLLLEVAAIRERQGQPSKAEAQYRRILGMRPDDGNARARLETLYRAGGRWIELAASLEERTDPRLGTAAPEAERPALLRELAAIYTDHLGHPHDGIDTLERLRQLAPTDVGVLRDLGGLYARVGRWSKVIETHARIGEIADGTPEAREALRKVAVIYEAELELPERAIETLQQLVAQWPDDADAFASLDRLCEAQARWTDLVEVLRRRAALAGAAEDRARLLARRAAILIDWLNAPEEAATALRHARTILPEDADLADRLVTALVAAARHREAAAVLEGRIAGARDRGLGAGDLAALHIRLAQVRADGLGDPAGARKALDRAIELVPQHPTALAALGKLTTADDDPRAFVAAKLREADAATDDDIKVDALYAAGVAQRDRVADPAAARATFERILALRAYHADAIWALAGLIEQGGDPETAARLLEGRLEAGPLEPSERARILTQLAALARHAGVELVAERRLSEALDADAGHVPALIALADLYADAQRWDDLEGFLKDTLAEGVPGSTPAVIAELHRRLAQAYEKLGRDDDAYETLLTADRLHRGHLLIKLALGENRYKARRWREAALHLGALASHEEATRYASDVAQGLYHAALAEIRSLRPEKAPPLYARALELRPNYAPALQAMAELAMEQNDPRRAADLLTRQAMATDDPAERMRLFEALGDMALMMLSDESRARVCYEAAVTAAQPLEAKHVPLLEKLLERQDLAGDHLGAGKTAELMAAFGTTAAERGARLARAAGDYLAGGDHERARAAAERAIAADPYDLGSAEIASELQVAAGDFDAAAEILGRCLSGKDDGDEIVRTRKAALWLRLGDARRERGDGKSAHAAYERAVALAPDTAAAVSARRQLAATYQGDPARRNDLIELRRELAAATGLPDDVVAWADELRRAGRVDPTLAALDLAGALGVKPDLHQAAFLSIQKPHPFAVDEGYRGVVDGDDRAAYLTDPDDQPLGPVFATLAEAASLLWPDPEDALIRAGAGGARRMAANAVVPAAIAYPRIAAALGTGPVLSYVRDDAAAPPVQLVCAGTPIVVLGPAAAEVGSAIRFALGRVAELSRPERMIVGGLPDAELRSVFAALVRSFAPPTSHAAVRSLFADADVQRARDESIRSVLPVKLRLRFEQLFADLSPADLDLAAYVAASHRVADRAGLLVSGDAAAAVAASTQRGAGPEPIVRAVASPAYAALRAKLGIGVRAG